MISFFKTPESIIAVQCNTSLDQLTINKLIWAFDNATMINADQLNGIFVGPRKEMITPWSTNAVEITQNMGIKGIIRIEEYFESRDEQPEHDPMLQVIYKNLDQTIFTIDKSPEKIICIDDIAGYNQKEGLALSKEEIQYLEDLSQRLNRKLTDSEIFGFSQVNSEHCRHKIFNGIFIIDGKEKESSLFRLIKRTTQKHPNRVVSAYKDNCAFMQGPVVEQFAPSTQDKPDYFKISEFESVFSLKAETHNFPTTVEPFNGAATGTGGEIRDRIGGGKASFPIAGTAVYMTSYPRLNNGREWEKSTEERQWLYQTPEEILIKASNGASDFGNKFGQPLICGSVLTFEHFENAKKFGYDKVIMLAGGVGYGKKTDSLKGIPALKDKVVLLGGDNYRIGMGGGAVSSVATGEFNNAIELNAVQRSNPEMQKRAYNAIRAMGEAEENPIVSIHDHGAGGHLNCLSELVEETGGKINIDKLPIGDPTLSAKEVVGNESQERMGLVMKEKDIDLLKKVADRERAPMYVIGETTGDHQFTFINNENAEIPIDLQLADMFGNPPKTVMNDQTVENKYQEISYTKDQIQTYISHVLQLESVACKDYLTNKVDRSVTGRIAQQQCVGELQLPLSNLGVVTLDYQGKKGIATSIGHAPVSGLVDAANGSVLSIAEALTNIVWTPIEQGIEGVSLSANWMWPCRNEGEDARLYNAVEAASNFAIELGINIPTGKDSLSMTQKYKNGDKVYSPGTVIISAAGESNDVQKTIEPVLVNDENSLIYYIPFTKDTFDLGGSSFAQINSKLGTKTPSVTDAGYFKNAFQAIQECVNNELIMSGHDVSAGGLITTLLEMNFPNTTGGLNIDLSKLEESDIIKILFSEKPAVVVQVSNSVKNNFEEIANKHNIETFEIGALHGARTIQINQFTFEIDQLRDLWYSTSYFLDQKQSGKKLARERFETYHKTPLEYNFPAKFTGTYEGANIQPSRKTKSGIKAAIIREKGVNGDREMAWSMHLAGFDVKDVHMTDLISGRETLQDIQFIVFVGGFSNSDVLGSAKGWAGAFIYNEKAKLALDNFYARKDTMSLGVCNGCQLMVELGLLGDKGENNPKMHHNSSHKFESSFLSVNIENSPSIMLKSLEALRLGIWIAHGEGRFELPLSPDNYNIAMRYSHSSYPANPNGSDSDTAAICSENGRHLAMMPHLERSIYPWQWAFYKKDRLKDEVSPWIEAFINAKKWIEKGNH